MKLKWEFIFICLIICLFSIASVCAAEVNETVVANEDQSEEVCVEETTEDALSMEEVAEVVNVEDNQVLLKEDASDVGTFDELSSLITNTSNGGTLELDKDYQYVSGSKEGIVIDHAITIDGKGHTISGNNLGRAFFVQYTKNVTLKNIVFTKCDFSKSSFGGGGVIFWEQSSNGGMVYNCSFVDCYAKVGGAIYCFSDDIVITNSSFINCSAKEGGGAIFWNAENGILANSSFVNCSALGEGSGGGGVYWNHYNGFLANCSFINCTGKNFGNAIRWDGENGKITNTYFDPYYNSIAQVADDLVIEKLDVKILCNNISLYYLEPCDFKIYLKDYFDHNLANRKITIENKELSLLKTVVTDNNGCISIPTEFTKNTGNHTIYLSYAGDDNYNSIQNTFNLNIKPLDSSVITNNCSGTVGQNIALTVNIVCSNGVTIKEGAVTFFDGETNIGESNVVNGVATLNYAPTTAGKHTIKAIYSSNNYNSSNNTFIFTVSKASVDLNINAATVYFSNPSSLVVNINSNSQRVNEGKIKFYIDDVFIDIVDVYNGVANLIHLIDTTGSFNLTVVYDETDNYFGKNDSSIFYVNAMPTTLSGETTFFDEEQSKIFLMELKDNNDKGVSYQITKLEVIKYSGESKTFTNITDENGIVTFDVSELVGGMWMVRGIYEGDNNYLPSGFTNQFIVIRMNTTTSIDEITDSHKGYPIQLRANITDDFGQQVTDGLVYFYVDDETVGYIDLATNKIYLLKSERKNLLGASNFDLGNSLSETVDTDAYIEYIPTEGTHTLKAIYEGTSLYRPSNQTITFEVMDGVVPTTLTATSINAFYKEGKYLIATLKDSWNKSISGVNVSIKLSNGKIVNLTTDGMGQVKFSTGSLVPNNYTATISFGGNDVYAASSTTAKVIIKKINTNVAASKVTATYNVNKYLVVTLKDSKGNILANKKVAVKVGSISKTLTTNAKGQVSVLISKLVPKNYTAAISFAGENYYDKSSTTVKVVVKKATPKMTAKAKTFKRTLKTKKYTITLKNNKGAVMKNTKVTLTVNKKTYSVKTNSKGIATFKITNLKKKGKFRVVIKYAGSKYYNKVTKKPIITIKA